MAVKVKLEFKDFLRLQIGTGLKRLIPAGIVMLVVLLILVIYPILASSDGDVLNPDYFTWLLPILLIMLLVPSVVLLLIYITARHNFNNDEFARKEYTYTFQEDRFLIESEITNSDIKLSDLFKWTEQKHDFIIYASPAKAFIIPKRLLQAEDILQLRNLLKSGVTNKKTKWFLNTRILVWAGYIGAILAILHFSTPKSDTNDYFRNGCEKEKQGDIQGAIRDFDQAISNNPSFARAYIWRGHSKYYGGDKEGGCNDLYKASQLGDTSAARLIHQYCTESK